MRGSRIPNPLSTREVLDLPALVPLLLAARALSLGASTAYESAQAGTFPVETLRLGTRWYVRKADLLTFLGIEDPELADDEPEGDGAA